MKKVLIGIMVLILCVFTLGCGGNKKPDGISDDMYEKAVYAIKVVDLYLNGEATQDETYEKIKAIKIGEFEDYQESDRSIFTEIAILKLKNYGNISEIKEVRDKLAKEINYKG